MEFLEQFPLIHESVLKAEPKTGVFVYNKEGNLYNYYEELGIHGLVAIGDSICNFNPVYGQGITAASESVLLLDQCLRTGNQFK